MDAFEACFSDLEDPRQANARHDLLEIPVIALCMLCGGEDRADMVLFGRSKEPFPLRKVPQFRHCRLLWEHRVASSNLAAPTNDFNWNIIRYPAEYTLSSL